MLVVLFLSPLAVRACIAIRHVVLTPRTWNDRVMRRYRHAGTYAWMFAWFKTGRDPMFGELPRYVGADDRPRTALDLGCGFGVTGCWLLEQDPNVRVFGIDPDPARVKAAAIAFGDRGEAAVGGAPDFISPGLPDRFDVAFMLDMLHFISDEALATTLKRIRERMNPGGRLIIRAIIPPSGQGSRLWRFEALRRRLIAQRAWHRSSDAIRRALIGAGFTPLDVEMSGGNPESCWLVGTADAGTATGPSPGGPAAPST